MTISGFSIAMTAAAAALFFAVPAGSAQETPPWCRYALSDVPKGAPAFADYRTARETIARPAAVDVRDKDAHQFRTALRAAAKEGLNFAGHYAIASWGCGTGCLNFAVVDLTTGKVTFDDGMRALQNDRVDFERDAATEAFAKRVHATYKFGVMLYSPDSALFITQGMPNEDEARDGIAYYRWTGERFTKLAFYPAAKLCPRPKD